MQVKSDLTERIVYTCANCGWQADIPKQWADIKPKKCGNRKCKTYFLLNPEKLLVQVPPETQEAEVKKTAKRNVRRTEEN